MTPCKYGSHRVIEPVGSLPQAAHIIDATPMPQSNECLIDVTTLNIDSASFHQIKTACNADKNRMKAMILDLVKKQGKMQNPVTKSGGMLIGKVAQVGENFHNQTLKVGTPIATLVSLSLTPLVIDKIHDINLDNDQVHIEGKAILFDSGIYAEIPEDLSEKLVLAALDVAGAPAQVKKLAKKGDTVLIIGAAGKSGLLCAYQAKKQVGEEGHVIGLVNEPFQIDLLKELKLCDTVILGNAQDALSTYQTIAEITHHNMADLTINVVNVNDTEMASIMSTKQEGIVYFFSMATAFTKAALGAEGIGRDVTMIIGNGYTKDHADITLSILRENATLKRYFTQKFA